MLARMHVPMLQPLLLRMAQEVESVPQVSTIRTHLLNEAEKVRRLKASVMCTVCCSHLSAAGMRSDLPGCQGHYRSSQHVEEEL